jgi:integrase
MAYIRSLSSGNYRADVRMKGIIKNKTFPTASAAQEWADKLECSIKLIPCMSCAQLSALNDDDVFDLGGFELFQQLGIDLLKIRNKAKIDAINTLSKKELLELSPSQIEKMGGVNLFLELGKRIRYKTFAQVCEEYIAKWNKKDIEGQVQRASYWCNLFGDRMINDIDIFDVQDHVDTLIESGVRTVTILRNLGPLSNIFKFALGKEYVDKNFIRSIEIDNDAKMRDRVLTDKERSKLLDACKNSHWDKLFLLVIVAMTTGARRGELMKLKWRDICFNDHAGQILDSKNNTDREIHLISIAMNELRRFRGDDNEYIFASPKTGKPFDFRKAFSKALKAAEISEVDILNEDGSLKQEKFTFHCLRHGFCSQLSDSGKELSVIAKMAGHKSLQTTMRYIHQDKQQKRKITDEVAASFGI